MSKPEVDLENPSKIDLLLSSTGDWKTHSDLLHRIADLTQQLAAARDCIGKNVLPGLVCGRWYYKGRVYESRDKAIDAAIDCKGGLGMSNSPYDLNNAPGFNGSKERDKQYDALRIVCSRALKHIVDLERQLDGEMLKRVELKNSELHWHERAQKAEKAIKKAIADLTPDANDPDVVVDCSVVRNNLQDAIDQVGKR